MRDMLYNGVDLVAKVHDALMKINDGFEYSLSDKELHFLVIGAYGLILFGLVHVLFRWLSKLGLWAVSFVSTFMAMVVITFAIEIGQRWTSTGVMEFKDIAFGLWGFVAFSGGALAIIGLFMLFWRLITGKFKRQT